MIQINARRPRPHHVKGAPPTEDGDEYVQGYPGPPGRWTAKLGEGDALLSYAADIGADLIVRGGYGHSRAREMVFGGVTRTLLEEMTVPMLLSH
ncbi:MAG: universal stress protein [Acetobacteraceae bacterium]|nr:universal stress protein [Acetobacteraceae bacterium]